LKESGLMKEMLSYASPEAGALDPRRKSAAAHARSNGRGCIIFGLFFMIFTVGEIIYFKTWATLACWGFYAGLFLTSGVLHMLCGSFLRRPNAKWEAILRYTAAVHVVGLLPLVVLLGLAMMRMPSAFLGLAVALGVVVIVGVSLGVGWWKVRGLRRE